MNPMHPSTVIRRHSAALLLLCGMTAAHVCAQTAPAPTASATATKSEETILLTPFQVSTDKDRGYFGGSTLAGGRADTPLKITPASISVMTKEFLEDFDLTDMNQALSWTVGADAPTGGESGAFGGNRFQTSFRGVDGNGNFPVRNGSINYYVADSYNSERYDFSRGPNAALFGDGGPGGLQGSTSKQARLNSKFTSTSARVDSFGGYRTTLDTNYGLGQVALRLNLLRQDIKAIQKGTSNQQNGFTVALTYKLTDNTQFRAEVQRDGESNVAYRRLYNEQASRWNRTTVNETNTAIPSPNDSGLGQISPTNDYQLWNFGTNSLMNYKGFQYQSLGLGYQIPWRGRADLPNFKPGIGKTYALGPADTIIDRDFNYQAFTLDHRVNANLYVQLGIVKNDGDPYYENADNPPADYRLDVNRLLPSGASNPNFGKAYADFQQGYAYQQDRVREYKFAGTYKFAAPKFFDLKQRFSVNTGWRRTTFEALNQAWRWSNNPASPLKTALPTTAAYIGTFEPLDGTQNSLRYRVYWDQPRPRMASVTPPPDSAGVKWALVQTGGNINQRTITYGQIVSQTTFWDERLALTGSFRRDKVEGNFRNRIGADPVTLKNIVGFQEADGLFYPGHVRVRTLYQNSPSAGLVTYPFKGMNRYLSPLGFVANYSSNFAQIANSNIPLITGENPALTHAKTTDAGLRYAVGDGVAYVTLSHYKTTQENQLSGWGSQGDFRNLYSNLGYTDPLYTGSTGFNYQDQNSRKLEGWEAEVTANPTRNLTFTANYSHPIVYTITESFHRRAFYAKNLLEYQAGALASRDDINKVNGQRIIDPNVIAQSMLNIENSFNGANPGTLGNGLERHRVNLAGSYRFTEGVLKGLGLNAGFNYRAHKKVGSRDARIKFQVPGTTSPTAQQSLAAAYDYLWVTSTFTAVAGANYTHRFGRYTARFQLNITNLLNDDKPLWNSYSVIPAGQLQNLPNAQTNNGNALTVAGGNPRLQVRSGFSQNEPRKISFTTTLSF